jgi:hypothetical protein
MPPPGGFLIGLFFDSWTWRQYFLLKCQASSKMHSVVTRETALFIVTIMRAFDSTSLYSAVTFYTISVIQDKFSHSFETCMWFWPHFLGFALFQTLRIKWYFINIFYITLLQICIKYNHTVFIYLFTQECGWLKHYATSWKVVGSIPSEVIGFYNRPFLPAVLWPWGQLSL